MAKEKKTKATSLEDVINQINQDFGEGSVQKFGERPQNNYEYISTDSIAFDAILGGGIILGKMYELMGWEGSGKSTICGHIAKNAQIRFPDRKVVYIDSENSLDVDYFTAIGVNVNDLYVVQVRSAEQGFAITEQLINSGEVSVCIIDSDTAMQPQALIEGEMGELKIGLKARLNGQVYPRLHRAIGTNDTALIVVSQYREKVGIVYGSPVTTNGGHSVKFTADCRIEISKSLEKNGEDIYGSTITAKAVKNRMAPPFKKAQFEVVFGKGINKLKDLVNIAIDLGIVKKAGAGWISYADYKIQGLDNFIQLLEDNEEVKLEIEAIIKEKFNIK